MVPRNASRRTAWRGLWQRAAIPSIARGQHLPRILAVQIGTGLTALPAHRHEGGRGDRVHLFAALIGAGGDGLQDAPAGARGGNALVGNDADETYGVAREHRPDP